MTNQKEAKQEENRDRMMLKLFKLYCKDGDRLQEARKEESSSWTDI